MVHSENGYRVVDPARTIERIKKAEPAYLAGIDLVRRDLLDRLGIPVYVSFAHYLPPIQGGKTRTHWGKGVSREQAMASALCETLERYSANVFPDTIMEMHSCRELGARAYDPRRLITDSPEARTCHVPFDMDAVIPWEEGYQLLEERRILVPAACVHFPFPDSGKGFFANQSTNGLAAGNTREEAILQGMLELVERDATYCILRNRIIMPDLLVAPGAFGEIDDVIGRITEAGFRLHLKDLTTDIDIPTIGALIIDDTSAEGPLIAHGYGTHLSPRIALLRALTEAVQTRTYYLHHLGTLAGASREEFMERNLLFRRDGEEVFSCLIAKADAAVDFLRMPDPGRPSIRESLHACYSRLASALSELDILAVDLTRPSVDFPVVRVIIPGLQNIDHDHLNESERLHTMAARLGHPRVTPRSGTLYAGRIP